MKENACHGPQEIIIIGATGKVGTELIKQITEKDGKKPAHLHPTKISMVANSGYFKILKDENAGQLRAEKMREFLEREGTPYDGAPKTLETIIGNENG
jgi:FlaA1/EpsC-like NDP-sugar epimerase